MIKGKSMNTLSYEKSLWNLWWTKVIQTQRLYWWKSISYFIIFIPYSLCLQYIKITFILESWYMYMHILILSSLPTTVSSCFFTYWSLPHLQKFCFHFVFNSLFSAIFLLPSFSPSIPYSSFHLKKFCFFLFT